MPAIRHAVRDHCKLSFPSLSGANLAYPTFSPSLTWTCSTRTCAAAFRLCAPCRCGHDPRRIGVQEHPPNSVETQLRTLVRYQYALSPRKARREVLERSDP